LPETLVENYVVKLDTRLTSLEDNVQKLTTIINKIVNDQAVFDFKQEQNLRVSSKLEEMVDKAREKLEAVGSDFIKELDKREARLNDALLAYKKEVDKACDKHKDDVDSEIERLEANLTKLTAQVADLQRWVWLATGGGAVALFVFEVVLKVLNIG
jgi:phage shock protein A